MMNETRRQTLERPKALKLSLPPATHALLQDLMKSSGHSATQVFEDALDALVEAIEKVDTSEAELQMLCADCELGTWVEYYMVHDAVWQAANAPEEALLCIGCLEHRLGRKLTRHDFDGALINQMQEVSRSRRLLDRMSRE